MTDRMTDRRTGRSALATWIARGPYLAYAYAYPHKTAYRPLAPPLALRELWAEEDRSALLLYLHVPFCEQRCGFCNLFTQVRPKDGAVEAWLRALERQAAVVGEALGPASFVRLAIGGGTPTLLDLRDLERVLLLAERLGARGAPASVEVSPATADPEKVALLREFGVSRVSVGVQSMEPDETAAVQRPQEPARVRQVLGWLEGVPQVNADLIYGLPGQTAATLRASIDGVIDAGANELYLYPLYTRPLTGLADRGVGGEDERLTLYRAGRDHLRARGWRQLTLRAFRGPGVAEAAGSPWRCQEDGTVGLGPGARSYTRRVHWSTPYAVRQAGVRARVAAWSAQTDAELGQATHGFVLDGEEQRRRFAVLSVLEAGLDRAAWSTRFGTRLEDDLPELGELVDAGLAYDDGRWLRLGERGVELSDVIGAWLESQEVRARRDAWDAA
jgi:oxygen-independent coproporphyrinogen-3 oxidase